MGFQKNSKNAKELGPRCKSIMCFQKNQRCCGIIDKTRQHILTEFCLIDKNLVFNCMSFFDSLEKLESHYYRKYTKRFYLVDDWTPKAETFRYNTPRLRLYSCGVNIFFYTKFN